jgi:hypothetical protein
VEGKLLTRGLASVDDADLRQVFAYARVLNTSCAALVYPKLDNGAIDHAVVVADGSGIVLMIRQVTLPAVSR